MQAWYDFETLRLAHRHDDGSYGEMRPREHTVVDHDPERQWDKGARIYDCECGESFTVSPTEPPEPGPDDAVRLGRERA